MGIRNSGNDASGEAGGEEHRPHRRLVPPQGGELQLLELGSELRIGCPHRHQAVDVGVAGGEDLLVRRAEYLVEFLSRTHPGDLDGNVNTDLAAGQPDHPLGQIDDLDGNTHLQHEDLAPNRQD